MDPDSIVLGQAEEALKPDKEAIGQGKLQCARWASQRAQEKSESDLGARMEPLAEVQDRPHYAAVLSFRVLESGYLRWKERGDMFTH